MTISYATALARMVSVYWNAQSKTDSNPGGFGANGHKDNLPEVAEAIGVVATEVAAQADAATTGAATVAAAVDTATGAAATATEQAGIATTKAGEAADSAAAAAAAVGGVKVSANDTTPGDLEAKLLAGAGLVASTQNDGGNETRTIAVDPDQALETLTLTGRSTRHASGEDKALYLGDVSGDVVIEATDPLHIYCTITGDTVFLMAGADTLGFAHDHIIHWVMGGSGGYSVTYKALNHLTHSGDLRSTAEAGETRPWIDTGTSLVDNAAVGPDGRADLTELIEDISSGGHGRHQVLTGFSPNQTLTWSRVVKSTGDARNVRFNVYDADALGNSIHVTVNPATGAVVSGPTNTTNATGAAVVVTALDNDCFLVELTGKPNTSGTNTYAAFQLTDGVTTSYLGDGSSVYLGEGQLSPGGPTGIVPVGASRDAVVQGTALDGTAISADPAVQYDTGVSVEPNGRIVIQDHTVEEI